MSNPRIVIEVKAGCVVAAYGNMDSPDEVMVVDLDVAGTGDNPKSFIVVESPGSMEEEATIRAAKDYL